MQVRIGLERETMEIYSSSASLTLVSPYAFKPTRGICGTHVACTLMAQVLSHCPIWLFVVVWCGLCSVSLWSSLCLLFGEFALIVKELFLTCLQGLWIRKWSYRVRRLPVCLFYCGSSIIIKSLLFPLTQVSNDTITLGSTIRILRTWKFLDPQPWIQEAATHPERHLEKCPLDHSDSPFFHSNE